MKKVLLSITVLIMLSSCASVLKGTSQVLNFSSSPEGAEVIIDGISQGSTPLAVNLKKNKYSSVMFKKNGYETRVVPIQRSYDGIALLNIFWDLSTTDMITGAAFEYEPGNYHVTLTPSESSSKKSN